MKQSLLLLMFVFSTCAWAQNQVGINQSNVDPSAVLEMNSTTQGFLIPRLTSNNKLDVEAPVQGLIIYELTSRSIWYFNGAAWIKILSDGASQDGIGDTDSDTRIYLDYTNDNDQIRYFSNGLVRFRMNRKRFDVLNNGNSVFIGDSAGYSDNLSSNRNVFIGTSSGLSATNAPNNVGIGYQTLMNLTTLNNDVAIGSYSARSGVTARRNVTIGSRSLFSNITSDYHIAIGHNAYEFHTSNGNGIAIGVESMRSNTRGSYNIGLGDRTLENNLNSYGNIALGYEALRNTSGSISIGIGFQAGLTNSSSSRLYIDNSASTTPLMHCDFSTNVFTINDHLRVTSNIDYVGTLTDVSDKRLKKRIKPVTDVLPQLVQLNAYRYHLKDQPAAQKEYGFVAQEVAAVFPTLARKIDPAQDLLGVSYVQFIPLILQAEKEQYQQLQAHNGELEILEEELISLEEEIARIAAKAGATAQQP